MYIDVQLLLQGKRPRYVKYQSIEFEIFFNLLFINRMKKN